MAKFMLIKISFMAEITDADALREAALKNFDAADMTSADHPDTADWHASENGQEERRRVATQDRDALNQLADPTKACGLLEGVPGAKVLHVSSSLVDELEGTTQHEARDAWANREGITARGLHGGPARSRLTRTCLLVQARQQHDFATSARRSGLDAAQRHLLQRPSGVVVR